MITSIIIITITALFYFLPSFVAASRKNERAGQIFILNLFLGWTLIGWVIALVWAVGKNQGSEVKLQQLRKCPYCQEDVQAKAVVCKHCKSKLTPILVESAMNNEHTSSSSSNVVGKPFWKKDISILWWAVLLTSIIVISFIIWLIII